MKYVALIAVLIVVGYLLLAWRRKLGPFSGKTAGVVTPKGKIAEQLARLRIPEPLLRFGTVTPAGVPIQSTVIVPQTALNTIDAALEELFVRYRAAYPAWMKAFTHREYAILFIDPMATNQDGSPAIAVQGQQSAGTCIGLPFPMSYLVLPHQERQGWSYRDYLFNSVLHEAEHFLESHNDRAVFDRYTGLQDTHPHVPPINV